MDRATAITRCWMLFDDLRRSVMDGPGSVVKLSVTWSYEDRAITVMLYHIWWAVLIQILLGSWPKAARDRAGAAAEIHAPASYCIQVESYLVLLTPR